MGKWSVGSSEMMLEMQRSSSGVCQAESQQRSNVRGRNRLNRLEELAAASGVGEFGVDSPGARLSGI